MSHLLVVSLHTQEDGVRCEAGQAAFNIRLTSQLLRFSVQVVQRPHCLFELLFVDLKYTETRRNKKGLTPLVEAQSQMCMWMVVCEGFLACWDI